MRCRLLMFVVDTAGSEARDPITDLETLRTEISLYSDELAKRPWCILANKMDLPGSEENLALIKDRFKRVKILPISADSGLGMDKLHKFLDQKIGHNTE
jgi:GTP-binding protein